MRKHWYVVLLAITFHPWEEPYGTPPHHVETKKSLLFKCKFWFVVCWRVTSPQPSELRDLPLSREPCRRQLFLLPILHTFCSESRSSKVFHDQESWLPFPGEQVLLLWTWIHGACSTNPGKNNFVVPKNLSHSTQSVETFSLSESPVAKSREEMSTWSPLEAKLLVRT